MRKFHNGEFGGMVFGSGAIKTNLTKLHFHRHQAIVYMNEEAKRLMNHGGGGQKGMH